MYQKWYKRTVPPRRPGRPGCVPVRGLRTGPSLLSTEDLRELLRRALVRRGRVEDEPLLGLLLGVEDRVLERHRAHDGVVDRSAPRAVARDLVLLPRLAELGAAL